MGRGILVVCSWLVAGAGVVSCAAQTDEGTAVERGRLFTLPSRVLGESRAIEISLPADYTSNTERVYPVLIVLDGEFEHEIAAAISRFYAAMSPLPSMIVVGVRNADRMRDMTPTPVAGFTPPSEAASGGGADRFLAFLGDELMPYLEQQYRVAPMRVLVGHSLGGLFALHVLGSRPELFTGYLVMEPAVWWNNQHELETAASSLRQPAARRARVMLVNSPPLGIDTTRWGGDAPMVREINVVGESHSSMAMAGMMLGLRMMFSDFQPPKWVPGTRPVAMLARYDSLAHRIGYEVPIPETTFSQVIRMSIHGRYFEDADRALERMELVHGGSEEGRGLRSMLAEERGSPVPVGFIPLEIPSRRPTPTDAAAFIGRWITAPGTAVHEVTIRASGDTIVVHDRVQFPNGQWWEEDSPVIQVTADGTLEWGLRWFNGIAALVVLQGKIGQDGTMTVTREVRGWVPRGPGGDLTRVERLHRLTRS